MSYFEDLRIGDLTAPLLAFWLAALLTGPMERPDTRVIGGLPREAVVATVMLHGTAANGGSIGEAMVTVINGTGQRRRTTTDLSGKFSIEVTDAAPYLLRVQDAAGENWYSYAAGPGVANITPLTTLALLDAHARVPLDVLTATWAEHHPAPQEVWQASRKVNAHLLPLMRQELADPTAYNVFTTEFNADHRGIDGVLDRVRVATGCDTGIHCAPSIYSAGGELLMPWNSGISTAGITAGWAGLPTTPESTAGTATEPAPGTTTEARATTAADQTQPPAPAPAQATRSWRSPRDAALRQNG
jgi:hypothetical protein